MKFFEFIACIFAIIVLSAFLWIAHVVAGWWGVIVVGGLMAVFGWHGRPTAVGDYYIPTEEITIIDKDGNAKTYRKK